MTGNTAKKDFIKIGKDEVPSVRYIVGGGRDVNGVNNSKENGITKKIISYKVSSNQNKDMERYAEALVNDYGYYYVYSENDFSGPTGVDLQLVKKSVEDDYILYVRIDYDTGGYTITLTRGRGTLTILD